MVRHQSFRSKLILISATMLVIGIFGISCVQSNKYKPPLILPKLFEISLPENLLGFIFSPKDGLLHGWSHKGIRIFDSQGKIRWGYSEWVTNLGYSADGKTEVIFFNHRVMVNNRWIDLRVNYFSWPALVSPDGTSIVIGESTSLKLIPLSGKSDPITFLHGGGHISAAGFSPDGKFLAIGAYPMGNSLSPDFAPLNVWDLSDNRIRFQTLGSTVSITVLTYSPDGDFIASGGKGPVVHLWDTNTGLLARELTGLTGDIRCLYFSPKGHLLAAGSTDKVIYIWDYSTGEKVLQILPRKAKRHQRDIRNVEKNFDLIFQEDWVTDVAFSIDGNQLAAAYSDRSLVGWDARPLYNLDLYNLEINTREVKRTEIVTPDQIPVNKTPVRFQKNDFVGIWLSSRSGTAIEIKDNFMWDSGTDSGKWLLEGGSMIWIYYGKEAIIQRDINEVLSMSEDEFVLKEMDSSITTFKKIHI